jgi:hypothetical protein
LWRSAPPGPRAGLFGDRLDPLELSGDRYVERSPAPEAYCAFFEETFGPLIAIRASLAEEPARLAALEREFREFAALANEGPAAGPAEYPYEFPLVVGKKSGS